MRIMILSVVILLLYPPTASRADIVWEYPFDDLPGVWSDNGRWYQDADSAWIHRDRFLPGASGPETKWLMYSTLTVPFGVESLTVDLDYVHSLTGYAISGGWGASIAFSSTIDGSDSHMILHLSETGDSMDPGGSSSGHVQYTLPASSGEAVILYFDAFTNLWGTISEVHLDWIIWNMTLTGHTAVALENSTWAAIKLLY